MLALEYAEEEVSMTKVKNFHLKFLMQGGHIVIVDPVLEEEYLKLKKMFETGTLGLGTFTTESDSGMVVQHVQLAQVVAWEAIERIVR